MSKFTWVRNPTIINGLATLYVSKKGSDTLGNGTAQNPYASIAKATSVAFDNTNIMLGDGEWDGARTNNGRSFIFWGNGKTKILGKFILNTTKDEFNNIAFYNNNISDYDGYHRFNNCFLFDYCSSGAYCNCIIINCLRLQTHIWNRNGSMNNCIVIDSKIVYAIDAKDEANQYKNNIFINTTFVSVKGSFFDFNNFTSGSIIGDSTCNQHSINNTITGQTFDDYFNYYDSTDWLKCDFTAKDGSKNIGAGEKGTNIGLNQGYTMYADNSSNDVFKASNGAVLKNVSWNENLQGYTIVQKEKVSPLGGTFGAHTITLDSSASSENGYYVGLFIGIVGGNGAGQIRLITNYNGASRLCGVDRDWDVIPDSNSVYTISGTITSAVKDLGKAIKVKRNWLFADMTSLTDGRWSEFLTSYQAGDTEMNQTSAFQWEYSLDGATWKRGTDEVLASATDGEMKLTDMVIGDMNSGYDEENALTVKMRYCKVKVHIGFNIGE